MRESVRGGGYSICITAFGSRHLVLADLGIEDGLYESYPKFISISDHWVDIGWGFGNCMRRDSIWKMRKSAGYQVLPVRFNEPVISA